MNRQQAGPLSLHKKTKTPFQTNNQPDCFFVYIKLQFIDSLLICECGGFPPPQFLFIIIIYLLFISYLDFTTKRESEIKIQEESIL